MVCLLDVCQGVIYFLKPSALQCHILLFVNLPSVNMIEVLEMEIAVNNLAKKPCKTCYSPGRKNQFRRHIVPTWFYLVNTLVPDLSTNIPKRSHLEVFVLNYKQQADQIFGCISSQSMAECISIPHRQLNDWLLGWVWCVSYEIAYSTKQ